ncbi:MAG TPA: hypothetical protein VHP37_05455 [Burkholderiales bacterium]|nr:hypothetical protein [Burkholderiales bacterium]
MERQERKLRFGTDPITEECWEFDLDGPFGQAWVWRRVDTRGCVLDRSRPFASCLAAVRDARAHGFSGRADIVRPAPQPVQRRR